MSELNIEKLIELQKELQEQYKGKWAPVCPETAKSKLLYLFIEAGEAADVIKKQGDDEIMNHPATRKHFIEEMFDTLMYFNDILLCYGITPEEFEAAYLEKHARNMKRWTAPENV